MKQGKLKKRSMKRSLRIVAKRSLELFEEFLLNRLRLLNRIEYIFERINSKSIGFHTFSSYDFENHVNTSRVQYLYENQDRPLILIQGAISSTARFESQAINHYLSLHSKQEILISTWDDSASRSLEKELKKFGNVKFLFNVAPEKRGPANINLQITNTKNGLINAVENGHKYVVKTRTDQCMMHPRALENLLTIHKEHQTSETSRLVINSLNTFLFRPYGASDMFSFGESEQLLKYWNAPLDRRNEDQYDLNIEGATLRNIAQREFGETYLGCNFLRAEGIEPEFTLSQSLEFITRYFIVVDLSTTNLLWNKYSSRANRWPNSSSPIPYQEIDYSLWLAISRGSLRLEHLDYLLDKPVWNREFSNE
jgi:hypothetical protein